MTEFSWIGKTRIAVPRARLAGEDGSTREWRGTALRAHQGNIAVRGPLHHPGRALVGMGGDKVQTALDLCADAWIVALFYRGLARVDG